jgi:hypothetical protein
MVRDWVSQLCGLGAKQIFGPWRRAIRKIPNCLVKPVQLPSLAYAQSRRRTAVSWCGEERQELAICTSPGDMCPSLEACMQHSLMQSKKPQEACILFFFIRRIRVLSAVVKRKGERILLSPISVGCHVSHG